MRSNAFSAQKYTLPILTEKIFYRVNNLVMKFWIGYFFGYLCGEYIRFLCLRLRQST